MEAKKVYESLVHLLSNVVKTEKLRYELTDKTEFKDKFVNLVNDLLVLEKDYNQEWNEIKWSSVFGKSIVKITSQKQRFEKPDLKPIEDIYADYVSFVSYAIKFDIKRNQLTDQQVNFSESEVLFNSTMNEQIKQKYKEIENEKKEELDKENKSDLTNSEQQNSNEKIKLEENNSNATFIGAGGFGGSGFNQQANLFQNMPVHPMRDPRFYPYDRKPKWMPWAKRILSILAITTSILLIVVMSLALTIKVDYSGYLSSVTPKNGTAMPGTWAEVFKSDYKNFQTIIPIATGNMVQIVFSFFFFVLPSVYLAYSSFKSPNNGREKYRVSYWNVLFMVIFFSISIFDISKFVNSNQIKNAFNSIFNIIIDKDKFNFDMGIWWGLALDDYGSKIDMLNSFTQATLAIVSLTIVFGIVLLIINPRIDRNKMMKANEEMQKATAAILQGKKYEMDPSLYEDDENIVVIKKDNQLKKQSKFKKWKEKTFKNKKKDNDSDKN